MLRSVRAQKERGVSKLEAQVFILIILPSAPRARPRNAGRAKNSRRAHTGSQSVALPQRPACARAAVSALLRRADEQRFGEIKQEKRPKEPGIVPVQTPKKENVPLAKTPPRKLAKTEQTQDPLHLHHKLQRAVPRHALHPGLASAHSLG